MEYAELSRKSYLKANRQPHLNYSMLEMCGAYYNLERYEECISLSRQLTDSAKVYNDEWLNACSQRLLAQSYYSEARYAEAISVYDSLMLCGKPYYTMEDRRNHGLSYFAAGKIHKANEIYDKLREEGYEESWLSYKLSAQQGDYKTAYYAIFESNQKTNKALQESISQNVTRAVASALKEEQARRDSEKEESECKHLIKSLFLLSVIAIISFLFFLSVRAYRRKEQARVDLVQALSIASKENAELNNKFFIILKERLMEIDALCMEYYEKEKDNNKIYKKINTLISGFEFDFVSNAERIKEINKAYNNVLTKIQEDYPTISQDNYILFVYLVCGFSPQATSLCMKKNLSWVYKHKSRLKEKIMNSGFVNKEEFLQFFH